ncbi:MAG: hypothetical protein HQ511_14125 [Rhodospirillales bacterium]|nr:hypothetical protein [Rhodospirillales bacterium]
MAAKLKPNQPNTGLSPAGVTVALLSTSLVMVVFALPTFLIIVFGLAPTWVAFLTDKSYGKAKGFAVGTFNMAGATPFFVRLWRAPDQMDASIAVLSDAFSWLVMYGTAGVSLVLIWVAPSFTTAIMEMRAAARGVRLDRRQNEIIENWGDETEEEARLLLVQHGYLGPGDRLGQRVGADVADPES